MDTLLYTFNVTTTDELEDAECMGSDYGIEGLRRTNVGSVSSSVRILRFIKKCISEVIIM